MKDSSQKRHYPSYLIGVFARPALKAMMHKSQRSRVIIRSGNKVVLVRNRLGSQNWSLPGGGLKRKESPEQAAVRELKEELKLDFSPDALKIIKTGRYQKTKRYYYDYVAFETDLPEQPLRFSRHELLDAQWFDLDGLPGNVSALTRTLLFGG